MRKIRCDARPGGCTPCLQNNTECRTTDRITGRATSRGHTESIEAENNGLKAQIADLRQQLEEHGIEARAPAILPNPYSGNNETQSVSGWSQELYASLVAVQRRPDANRHTDTTCLAYLPRGRRKRANRIAQHCQPFEPAPWVIITSVSRLPLSGSAPSMEHRCRSLAWSLILRISFLKTRTSLVR